MDHRTLKHARVACSMEPLLRQSMHATLRAAPPTRLQRRLPTGLHHTKSDCRRRPHGSIDRPAMTTCQLHARRALPLGESFVRLLRRAARDWLPDWEAYNSEEHVTASHRMHVGLLRLSPMQPLQCILGRVELKH